MGASVYFGHICSFFGSVVKCRFSIQIDLGGILLNGILIYEQDSRHHRMQLMWPNCLQLMWQNCLQLMWQNCQQLVWQNCQSGDVAELPLGNVVELPVADVAELENKLK